jgi:histidine triad (HIT) family protein
MDKCVFCDISSGKIPAEKIFENENFFSVFDANPLISGHALVISKKHFENILSMPSSLGLELVDCIKNTSLRLMEKYHAHGFNVTNNCSEAAGQTVKHVHFHIFPRMADDNLKLSFYK